MKWMVEMFDESGLAVNGLMRGSDSPWTVAERMSNDEVEEDVDPYEALDVSNTAPAARGATLLDALGEEEEEEIVENGETFTLSDSEPVEINDTIELSGDMQSSFLSEEEIVEEEEDVDPFEELGAARPIELNQENSVVSDALAAFMDDDESEDEVNSEFVDDLDKKPDTIEEEVVEEKAKADPEELYRFLLEGVWVDDVLDPAEVSLMARKRRELNISFETHLKILREVLHE